MRVSQFQNILYDVCVTRIHTCRILLTCGYCTVSGRWSINAARGPFLDAVFKWCSVDRSVEINQSTPRDHHPSECVNASTNAHKAARSAKESRKYEGRATESGNFNGESFPPRVRKLFSCGNVTIMIFIFLRVSDIRHKSQKSTNNYHVSRPAGGGKIGAV
jgi:hypothetical protein